MNKLDKDLVSVREFAARLAVTLSAIRKAQRRGAIHPDPISAGSRRKVYNFTTEGPKFIATCKEPYRFTPEMIESRHNLHPELRHIRKRHRSTMGADLKSTPERIQVDDRSVNDDNRQKMNNVRKALPKRRKRGSPPDLEQLHTNMDNAITMSSARASREFWHAKHQKFQYEMLSGKHIQTEFVAEDWENIATTVRVGVMELPDRIDAQLVGFVTCECGCVRVDRIKVNELVSKECKRILEKVAYDAKQRALLYASQVKRKSRATQDTEDELESED